MGDHVGGVNLRQRHRGDSNGPGQPDCHRRHDRCPDLRFRYCLVEYRLLRHQSSAPIHYQPRSSIGHRRRRRVHADHQRHGLHPRRDFHVGRDPSRHHLRQSDAVDGRCSSQPDCELRYGQRYGDYGGGHIGSSHLHHQPGAACYQRPQFRLGHGGRSCVHPHHLRSQLHPGRHFEVGIGRSGDHLRQPDRVDGSNSL
jgi:hypothetical protein